MTLTCPHCSKDVEINDLFGMAELLGGPGMVCAHCHNCVFLCTDDDAEEGYRLLKECET